MTRYLTLAEYFLLVELITGGDAETIIAGARVDLADSALHAPGAEFGGTEFYPDVVDKAAVLLHRLARNHPLIDGNKRAAWLSMVMFFEVNSVEFAFDSTHTDDAQRIVESVAAGSMTEGELAVWLRRFVR